MQFLILSSWKLMCNPSQHFKFVLPYVHLKYNTKNYVQILSKQLWPQKILYLYVLSSCIHFTFNRLHSIHEIMIFNSVNKGKAQTYFHLSGMKTILKYTADCNSTTVALSGYPLCCLSTHSKTRTNILIYKYNKYNTQNNP